MATRKGSNSRPGSLNDEGADTDKESVRLNKYIAECGIASRRKADELINEGSVMVNGKKVYELGTRIVPGVDRITVKGKPVKPPSQMVYILFNKPKNVVTTMDDPFERPTIKDFFARLPVRVFPVGRLDWDSEGMILLTNDGEFAQKVNHPREEILKTYLVKLNGQPTNDHLERLKRGVSIIGGKVAARHVERIRRGDSEQYDWVKIMIAEGKNRQIRLMFEKLGFDVMKLQRVAIGRLRMPGSLKRGEFVFLTEAGVKRIFEGGNPDKPERGPRQRSQKSEARDEASRQAASAGERPKPRHGARPGARPGSRSAGSSGRPSARGAGPRRGGARPESRGPRKNQARH